jgi:hypothetical protein
LQLPKTSGQECPLHTSKFNLTRYQAKFRLTPLRPVL